MNYNKGVIAMREQYKYVLDIPVVIYDMLMPVLLVLFISPLILKERVTLRPDYTIKFIVCGKSYRVYRLLLVVYYR